MLERGEPYEQEKPIIPAALDIIKIDGRWAQVVGEPKEGGIKFLDDGSFSEIKWDEYEIAQSFSGLPVAHFMRQDKNFLSEKEIQNIHWGSEQEKTPRLKLQVSVFGEFRKKQLKYL